MRKESLINFYLKYKIIIYPVLIGVASLFLIAAVILPQLKSYLKERENLENSSQRLQNLEVKAAELNNINTEELKKQLQISVIALPPDKDFADIVGVLQDLTVRSGLSLNTIQLGQVQTNTAAAVSNYTMKLEVFGSKSGLESLVESIEKASRVMKVSSIDLSAAKGFGGVTANLTIEVFFASNPQQLGSVEAALPKISDEEQKILVRLFQAQKTTGSISQNVPLPRGKSNPFE
ncbi:type 4a pilus biogenesis protein PilO [Candidatus Daviesbacteria bacterium]|nr:type 4a pilus biogenesis protein PilO [Candidatus Daviesbacteria bacterium]